MITTERGLALCGHFKLDYLVERITANLEQYNSWKFDGCSCLPDEMLGLFTGCRWEDITYRCCLPHDLCYAYGEPGNDIERKRVDLKFYSDLVTKAGMKKFLASAFLAGVRMGGREEFGLSFSWGFARKR
ncbi:MAG: hypothetical protein R6X27_03495 [Candidatus Desulfacyla sp.]